MFRKGVITNPTHVICALCGVSTKLMDHLLLRARLPLRCSVEFLDG